MASNAIEEQPAQVAENEYLDSAPGDGVPETKSGVAVNRNPTQATARFKKGDLVHKPVMVNGTRTKVTYTICADKYSSQGWFEYQVRNFHTNRMESGWVREKELKAGA